MKIKDLRGDMETRSGRLCQMAAYCRLSKDDGENKISESIEKSDQNDPGVCRKN